MVWVFDRCDLLHSFVRSLVRSCILFSFLHFKCLFDAYFMRKCSWFPHVSKWHFLFFGYTLSHSKRYDGTIYIVHWRHLWFGACLWEFSPSAFLTFNFHPVRSKHSRRQLPANIKLGLIQNQMLFWLDFHILIVSRPFLPLKWTGITTWWPTKKSKISCVNVLPFCFWNLIFLLENAWFNQENIERRPLTKEGNQCRKCVFFNTVPSFWSEWTNERTWNEFVIIIMGLNATRITKKRMLCSCWSLVETKNGSTSLNCTNNIKRIYNARLHAIFKAIGANDFMSLRAMCSLYTQCTLYNLLHNTAMDCIRLFHAVAFMRWCGLFLLDSAFHSPFYFPMETHFLFSLIFIRFYSTLLSLMLNAISSTIYIFFMRQEFSRHLLQLSSSEQLNGGV